MKKMKFICLSLFMVAILGLSLLFARVPVRASTETGYVEEEGFTYYQYEFTDGGARVVVEFSYPRVVFAGCEFPVFIRLITWPSDDEFFTIDRVKLSGVLFTVEVTPWVSDIVHLSLVVVDEQIRFSELKYTYKGFPKTKTAGHDMPITVVEEAEYYKQRYYELRDEIESLQEEIEDLEDALESEFGRGYSSGYEVGHSDGYNGGYYAGYAEGYAEAGEEIDALGEVVPSAIGSIWLVIRDFLSIEIFGIAIWEIVGSFVAIGVAIIIVRMFL